MTIHARPTADDLDDATYRKVCNGIGPAFGSTLGSRVAYVAAWPALAVAGWVGILGLYSRAGDAHDLHYAIGGQEIHKRQADGLFLAALLEITDAWPLLLRPFGWLISLVFWLAVAAGGWGSFRWRTANPYERAGGRAVSVPELVELVKQEAAKEPA